MLQVGQTLYPYQSGRQTYRFNPGVKGFFIHTLIFSIFHLKDVFKKFIKAFS